MPVSRLLLLLVLVAFGVRSGLGEEIVQGGLGNALDRYMSQAESEGFSGVLLVAARGEIAIAKGYGLADPKRKTPFTSETVFDIGSITKQFTAAAVMHLATAGKLSVSDKLENFFKSVPPDKESITLHHLLTHTAGLPDDVGDDYDKVSRGNLVQKAFAAALVSSPGTRYRYSNVGYSLLAAVIEAVSGQPYEKYLQDNLFAPSSMQLTGYRLPDWKKAAVARGTLRIGLDWGTPLDQPWADDGPYWNLRGNGGMLSTARDLYRWHLALTGDKVLSKAAKDELFKPHMRESPQGNSYYGYGWSIVETTRNTRLIAHDGSNGVFYAELRRYVDEDTVVIMASNQARNPARKHSRTVLNIVFAD